MLKKKVAFCCSSGIATSTVAAEKVTEYAREHGIEIDYTQGNVGEIPRFDNSNTDLIIVTSYIDMKINTPVVNALPLITGIGEEELLESIVRILKGE